MEVWAGQTDSQHASHHNHPFTTQPYDFLVHVSTTAVQAERWASVLWCRSSHVYTGVIYCYAVTSCPALLLVLWWLLGFLYVEWEIKQFLMGMPFLSATSYQNFNLLILIYVEMGKYFLYLVAKYKEILWEEWWMLPYDLTNLTLRKDSTF